MRRNIFISVIASIILFVGCTTKDNYSSYLASAREHLASGECNEAKADYILYKDLTDKSDSEIETLIMECESLSKSKYVDLGLPSGTLWSKHNEEGFYSYDEAVSKFGNNLPTKEQFEELKGMCTWTWQGNGYKVVGPSGEFIFLPPRAAAVAMGVSTVSVPTATIGLPRRVVLPARGTFTSIPVKCACTTALGATVYLSASSNDLDCARKSAI